jgi:hypothetical protein
MRSRQSPLFWFLIVSALVNFAMLIAVVWILLKRCL